LHVLQPWTMNELFKQLFCVVLNQEAINEISIWHQRF